MKLLLLSDLHLLFDKPIGRKDNTFLTQQEKLKYVMQYVCNSKYECFILQAGDFFDAPRSWRLLPIYIDFLRSWVNVGRVAIYCIRGQHDVYMYNEEINDRTTLGVLAKMGLVNILSSKPLVLDNICIYGTSYGQEIPKPSKEAGTNVLVIHAPILKSKIWHGQEDYSYAPGFLRKHKEYDLILCGDIHQKFIFRDGDRIICNTGCIIRKSVAQWEHAPGFYVYDTETKKIKWEEIPHEPPDEVMSREHLDKESYRNEMLGSFIEAVKSREVDAGVTFKDNLLQFMEESNIEQEVRDEIAEVMEKRK